MDSATSGSLFTLVVFVSFIGVVIWAFSKRNKANFDKAANLVFDDENKDHVNKENKQESSTNE